MPLPILEDPICRYSYTRWTGAIDELLLTRLLGNPTFDMVGRNKVKEGASSQP